MSVDPHSPQAAPDEDLSSEELATLLEEVRLIEAQSKKLVSGVMAGGYASVFRGAGIEFDEIREYVEGDDPRAVDWNVTARVGRPFVKEYVEERDLTLLFLLDLSASMRGGFSAWSARQMAARICACLALSATKNDDKVGFVGFAEGVEKFVPPRKGLRHVLGIVRDCLALRGQGRGTAMTPALEFAARVVGRRSVLFLVSDFMGDEDWRTAVTLCAKRHDVVAVRLFVPELTAPEHGLVALVDPESGQREIVDWGSRRVREAWTQRVAACRDRVARDLTRAGADLLDVEIPREVDEESIVRPILEFYRRRAERERSR